MDASLITRLAGPSTGKAGLAKDQTEINQIIAEASKGSKFFENEKRKDKILTEKIEKLLRHRDQVMVGVDVARLEANIDKMMMELEAQRDLTQYVVHVDLDAFFASVELLDNPSLKGKPFGVGKGVLTTASYEARLYGVRSGMAGFIAKKLCPHLIFTPIRGERYREMSQQVMDVLKRYDPNMMAAGVDEGYLNITGYCKEHKLDPEDCVQKMRLEVYEETNLTISAGIAPNRMLAKICSEKNKPNGQFFLPFKQKEIVAFMKDLPIRKIPGIGRVSERLLDSISIKTCGDIYAHRATLALLDKEFGLHSLLKIHLGIASNVVQAGQRGERKSIGSERSFEPLRDESAILSKLQHIATELEEDMERSGWTGKTITLKYKLDTFEGSLFTRSKSLTRYVSRKEELFTIGKDLLMPDMPLILRLIGLRVTRLKDLRTPEDQGLKRFFQSAGTSPTKKRQKLKHVEEGLGILGISELEDEDMMADHDENSLEETIINDGFDASVVDAMDGASSTLSTKSDSRSSHPSKPTSSVKSRPPRSRQEDGAASDDFQSVAAEDTTELVCPICTKVLNTDNTGLNAHVDFCLSKQTILAATASPSKKQFKLVKRE